MIIQLILTTISAVVRFIFGVLPSLPPAPVWLTDTLDTFVTSVSVAIGFISYVFTPTIFIFVLVTSVAIINFEYIYNTVLWVLRKLPLGSH